MVIFYFKNVSFKMRHKKKKVVHLEWDGRVRSQTDTRSLFFMSNSKKGQSENKNEKRITKVKSE